jgi:NitT/TauT family transport system substrate-binding protein
MVRRALLALALAVCAAACRRSDAPAGGSGPAGGGSGSASSAAPLRLGFFPNLTHSQALVGTGEGLFAKELGGRLDVKQFNAGPAAMEALMAGDLDVCYVGPGPASLAFLRSKGEALRVIAGAVSGGAVLVVRSATGPQDLAGQRVASPQLGNTQDVALRTWLLAQGLKLGDAPPAVRVTPLANADILGLFARGDLAGAWVPEPWGARLVHEAQGRILLDERDLWEGRRFPTTVLVASRRALEQRRADVLAALRVHVGLTDRWARDPEGFARAANAEYGRLVRHPLPEPVLRDAFSRMEPTVDPLQAQLAKGVERARALGFAPAGDLSGLVDRSLLDEAAPAAAR